MNSILITAAIILAALIGGSLGIQCYNCANYKLGGGFDQIYDPDCGNDDYSGKTNEFPDSYGYIGCQTQIFDDGRVFRSFLHACSQFPYKPYCLKNTGSKRDHDLCWCRGDLCNTNQCQQCNNAESSLFDTLWDKTEYCNLCDYSAIC